MIHISGVEVLIATGNPGKIREIEEALRGVPISWRYLREFQNILPVDETGETYEENAIMKAVSYSKQVGICALADDSGLEVDALGGLPGVRSARYGGESASDRERTERLLKALTDCPGQDRSARFVCCMAFAGWPVREEQARSDEPTVLHVCEDRCEGVIGEMPYGNNGFGYDPIFIPIGYTATFGELPSAVKNVISHRARALAAMRDFFNDWIV
jgi:non-canonical purine NTP pyrophosphatase (RdgB/HAM1 family)